jgi:hypothetical protein
MRKEKSNDLASYDVRVGRDGKVGIYLRDYNVRLATFAVNSHALRELLKKTFDDAAKHSPNRECGAWTP